MNKIATRKKLRRIQRNTNIKLKKRLFKSICFYPCRYCKFIFLVSDLTIEHIIPLSYGGTNEDSNIDLACSPCNKQKGKESWLAKRQLTRQRMRLIFGHKE